MVKDTIIDMGLGFKLEVIETIPDNKGNFLEGHLTLNGELCDVDNIKLYKTLRGLTNNFKKKIIPEYIADNAHKVYSIKYFMEENSIHTFVKEYFLNNKVNWGQVIDVILVLREAGYFIPTEGEKGFSILEWNEWVKVIDAVSLEMIKHLKSFGFGPDRNNSNIVGHDKKNKLTGPKHLIYTRYPWTSAYKIIKSAMSFLSISGRNFFASQDTTTFQKENPEAYEYILALVDALEELHIDFGELLYAKGFKRASGNFKKHMRHHEEDLHSKYKQMRPVGYGKYN